MTAVEQAEARRRESRWLATLLLLLCLTAAAMGLMTALARWGQGASPWPPVMGTPVALAALGMWIVILVALAASRALWLTRDSTNILREMHRRQDLIESFAAKAQNFAGSAAAQALHDLVLSTGLELVGGDTGSLMLASIAEKQLTIVAARGLAEDVVRTSRIQFGDRIAGLVAETKRPLLLGSGPAPAAIAPRMERQHELSSSLCVPLLWEGSTIGVLSVNRRHDRMPFTADDLESMGQLARSAEGQLAGLLSKPPSTANDP